MPIRVKHRDKLGATCNHQKIKSLAHNWLPVRSRVTRAEMRESASYADQSNHVGIKGIASYAHHLRLLRNRHQDVL
jgi:hypothetical protein